MKNSKISKYSTKRLLWTFSDVKIEAIIQSHIDMICKPKVEVVNWDKALVCTGTPEEIVERIIRDAKPSPRKAILIDKYLYLIHIIIAKAFNHNNMIRLNTIVLRKVFGDYIYDMLHNLKNIGVISISANYSIGKESRLISLENCNITRIEVYSPRIIKYQTILDSELKESSFVDDNISPLCYNKDFIDNYNNSLKLLELLDKESAISFIEKKEFKSELQRKFNLARINNFSTNNNVISTIDGNNRIYHYMTNLPKGLKKYFNIKYQIDISNSHPLLYSYYIIRYYEINNNTLKLIYNFNIDNNIDYTYHNVSKQLVKYLKINKIEENQRRIPKDVLLYIYYTMKGLFWDDFMYIFNDSDRGHIKASLFKEVFYSYSIRISSKKKYGKAFVKKYPHVWHVLREMKKNASENISNDMMKLESKLFSNILSECFKHGWKVFSIHDAVLVLDVEDNKECTVEAVEEIIRNVYNEIGLFPTVSVDAYTILDEAA